MDKQPGMGKARADQPVNGWPKTKSFGRYKWKGGP